MDSGIKRYKTITIVVIICAVAACLLFVFPTDRELIMTPSAHENIEFLTPDRKRMRGDRLLRFAVHDVECDYVQLCFSVPKQDRALLNGRRIDLRVDDEMLGNYSFTTRATWKRDYVIILMDHVESFSKITFTYEDQTIMIK